MHGHHETTTGQPPERNEFAHLVWSAMFVTEVDVDEVWSEVVGPLRVQGGMGPPPVGVAGIHDRVRGQLDPIGDGRKSGSHVRMVAGDRPHPEGSRNRGVLVRGERRHRH